MAAARAARGLSLESCAATLKLPLRVLRKIEAEDYSGIDSRVYLASYLGSYARLLDLPQAAVDQAMDDLAPEQPVLVATGTVPRGRYLVERYAVGATYVVLTALIAVPLLWLGVRGGLDTKLTQIAPLDMPVKQTPTRAATAQPPAPVRPAAPVAQAPVAAAPTTEEEKPLMASIAPFTAMEATPSPAPASTSATHSLRIRLQAASWVEVTEADGKRLEYDLLPAGAEREYRTDEPLEVRIGNADAASVEADGKPLDLAPYRHANVAHLELFKAAATTPADG
ncbi:MAG TPA: RodZ domain-containing protein [Mizugakiibacter sp.]